MTDPEVRQIKDSRVLAAMSHPLRRRLLDVLKAYGPQPVGALAERTGQAPANVSHHMRVLGESGLVEEATDLARDRRERWWRMAAASFQWYPGEFADDPATTGRRGRGAVAQPRSARRAGAGMVRRVRGGPAGRGAMGRSPPTGGCG